MGRGNWPRSDATACQRSFERSAEIILRDIHSEPANGSMLAERAPRADETSVREPALCSHGKARVTAGAQHIAHAELPRQAADDRTLPGLSATLMILFWTMVCIACVIRTGNARRRRTASSSSSDGQPLTSFCRHQIGGRHRILNREIDADAADRRHRMRGVADAKQPGTGPAVQPVDRHRQQLDVVPRLHVGHSRSSGPAPSR